MLRLTRTAIGLLTAQYRSVLRKCWAINVGVFALATVAATVPNEANAAVVDGTGVLCYNTSSKAVTYRPNTDGCISGETRLATMGAIESAGTVGGYSSAFGNQNTASGVHSSAFGYHDTAEGDYSSAFGFKNIASGRNSSAFGYNNTASMNNSSAFGWQNTASGDSSSAVGVRNTASGDSSSVVGVRNTASGYGATAIGSNSLTNMIYSYTNTDKGYRWVPASYTTTTYGTMAQGRYAQAAGNGSVAIGYAAIAGSYQTSEGKDNEKDENDQYRRYLTGAIDNALAIGNYANASGKGSSAVGYDNTASGDLSSAFGRLNTAEGKESAAFGSHNTASGQYSSAFGVGNTASGKGSSAFGFGARALDQYSIGLGHDAFALSTNAVALGAESVASDSVVSVGHLASDLNWEGNAYGSDLFRKIINVAAGSDAHDAVIVSQLGFTVGTATNHTNRVYSTVADYVSNNYYTKE